MIHILLLLLKIIGITLLSLLGLLVLIVLAILFVPIRYSMNAEAGESSNGKRGFERNASGGGENFDGSDDPDGSSVNLRVNARVSWLLHLLHAEAAYDGTFGVVIRLFGIPVKRIPEPQMNGSGKRKAKQKRNKRTKKRNKQMQKEAVKRAQDAKPEGNAKGENAQNAEAENIPETAETKPEYNSQTEGEGIQIKEGGISEILQERAESGVEAENEMQPDREEAMSGQDKAESYDKMDSENEEHTKMSFFQKLARFFRAVRAFFSKILYTIHHICDKIEKIKEQIGCYCKVLKSETGKKTFAMAKRELGKLFRHIAPTKLEGSITIGMDDPAVTGQIIAIASMFYPIYGNNVSITPDFDEKCMRGSLYLRGRIRVFTVLRIAWHIYFDKELKKFLHMLKREENEA